MASPTPASTRLASFARPPHPRLVCVSTTDLSCSTSEFKSKHLLLQAQACSGGSVGLGLWRPVSSKIGYCSIAFLCVPFCSVSVELVVASLLVLSGSISLRDSDCSTCFSSSFDPDRPSSSEIWCVGDTRCSRASRDVNRCPLSPDLSSSTIKQGVGLFDTGGDESLGLQKRQLFLRPIWPCGVRGVLLRLLRH